MSSVSALSKAHRPRPTLAPSPLGRRPRHGLEDSLYPTLRTFGRQTLLPPQPGHLWKIHQGLVRTVTWNEAGHLITLGFWGPGSLVGPALDQVTPYEIHPLCPVTAHSTGAHLSLSSRALLDYLSHTHALMVILHHYPMETRLLRLLHWLGQRFGDCTATGTHLRLPLTHQVLAETLGTTRVTITKLLQQLEQQGQLRWGRHQQFLTPISTAPPGQSPLQTKSGSQTPDSLNHTP